MAHAFFNVSLVRKALFFASLFFVVTPHHAFGETVLLEEALADLVKPSVVRIAEHVTGTAKIPAVKVDIKQRLVAVIPNRFTEVTVDEYLSGSGFIIHPDGYIATNAHVVSLETIKTSLASESALSAIYENALSLSEAEMQAFLNDEGSQKFSKEIIRYIIEHGEFALTQEVVVLRPLATESKMADLMASGFPASIIAVNQHFLDDERDVALLQIAERGLPALALGRADDVSVGKNVFIFGFPSTAEINQRNPSEATFTRGIISAIRGSLDGQLEIFQTDAKVSQGSSGGPLFNEHGEVLGLITFQTDELSRTAGDNFAFALPIGIVERQALEARILPEEGVYGQSFRSGLNAFLEKRCDSALSFFQETTKTNPLFLSEDYVKPYQEKCLLWQTEGRSRDSYWAEFRDGVNTMSNPLLYIFGGVILSFGILGAMMFWLLRQLRREENEIDLLEYRLRADEQELLRHERAAVEKDTPRRDRPVSSSPQKKV
ncbi:MAG: serine protease [Candidatus Moranbacteria bacterium]|nr:serine protease [Candidatus Moranbacteria bacterium]